jgi:hypothetical protein
MSGRQPDCIAIVQQKRLSDKMSLTTRRNPKRFGRVTQDAYDSKDGGRPYRFLYRINAISAAMVDHYSPHPLLDVIAAKRQYNANRADHKIANRLKEDGKKF